MTESVERFDSTTGPDELSADFLRTEELCTGWLCAKGCTRVSDCQPGLRHCNDPARWPGVTSDGRVNLGKPKSPSRHAGAAAGSPRMLGVERRIHTNQALGSPIRSPRAPSPTVKRVSPLPLSPGRDLPRRGEADADDAAVAERCPEERWGSTATPSNVATAPAFRRASARQRKRASGDRLRGAVDPRAPESRARPRESRAIPKAHASVTPLPRSIKSRRGTTPRSGQRLELAGLTCAVYVTCS